LEVASQPESSWAIMEGQVRASYGRVVYSHKTHEKCADILLARLSTIKFWQIVLSAASAAGFLSALLGVGTVSSVLGTVVATVLLGLNAYTKDYDLGEVAQKHKQTAHDLWLVREQYLSLLSDIAARTCTFQDMLVRRDNLVLQAHAAYGGAPRTNSKGYTRARLALKQLEDMSFTEQEIDAFLPKELKRSKEGT